MKKKRTRWLRSGQLASVLNVDQEEILEAAGKSGPEGVVAGYRIVKDKKHFESGWGGYSWSQWRYQGKKDS